MTTANSNDRNNLDGFMLRLPALMIDVRKMMSELPAQHSTPDTVPKGRAWQETLGGGLRAVLILAEDVTARIVTGREIRTHEPLNAMSAMANWVRIGALTGLSKIDDCD